MNPYLLPTLEFGPRIIARLMDRLAPDDLDDRRDPDRFTLREAIAHLADWEPILLDRMRTAVASPGARIETWDEGERAERFRYAESDPKETIGRWIDLRAETAEFLKMLPESAWIEAWVVHPERGRLSLEDQANMLLGHDLYHIEQYTQFLD
jgi:hypothetical protein